MSTTQSTRAKLSDTQLVILSAAAQRTNRSLVPFPKSLTTKDAALGKVVETLCKRNLAEERESVGSAEWRRDGDGASLGLFITTHGLLALGLDGAEKSGLQPAGASTTPLNATQRRPNGPAAPVQTKQVVSGRNASAEAGRQHPRHCRQDQMAAAYGAWVFERDRAQEAQAAARLGRGQGRFAPLSHRADRILSKS